MEIEQTGLRENPPGSLTVQNAENCEESLGERIQDFRRQCKDRDVDGESSKRDETKTCEMQQKQQETDGHKKQPDEELDPRIQVTENNP